MRIDIKKYSAEEWKELAQVSHFVMFEENRPSELDRIDYALLLVDAEKDRPCGYVTVRELDAHSVYWQYGGVMPIYRNSIVAFQMFTEALTWISKRYKRISTLVKNDNYPMLKFYIQLKAKIIGCRIFHGEVYLEHLIEF